MNLISPALLAALAPFMYDNGALKARTDGSADYRGKTRKGATHKVNPTFHSRNLLGYTPAEYRRRHLGKR